MQIVTLLLVLIIGISITIPLSMNKYTSKIPKPLILILIGIILSGSGGLGGESDAIWDMPSWLNPSSKESKPFIISIVMITVGMLMFSAGSHIDVRELSQKGPSPLLMGIIPSLCEGTIVGFLMLGIFSMNPDPIPWGFSFATGFAIASATPGVILPLIMKLQSKGYSKRSGINESVIVGASLDNITSLSMFLIFMKIATPQLTQSGNPPNITEIILLQTPWLFIFSGIIGLIFAIMFWQLKKGIDKVVPSQERSLGKKVSVNLYNVALFLSFILFIILMYFLSILLDNQNSSYAKFEFYLSSMIMGLVISFIWKSPKNKLNKIEVEKDKSLGKYNAIFWAFFGSIVVFTNTGTSISFKLFSHIDKVFISIAIIVIGLIARQGGVILSTTQKTFTWKERLFGGIAFIPKGTSTAAAIVLMQQYFVDVLPNTPQWDIIEEIQGWILMIAAVAIMFSIPTAYFLISYTGPKLLVPPDKAENLDSKYMKQMAETTPETLEKEIIDHIPHPHLPHENNPKEKEKSKKRNIKQK